MNIYQKLDGTITGACMRFLGQTTLMIMYVYNGVGLNLKEACYAFWLAAFITVQCTLSSPETSLGRAYDPSFWSGLLKWAEHHNYNGVVRESLVKKALKTQSDLRQEDACILGRRAIQARMAMDFVVNCLYREILTT